MKWLACICVLGGAACYGYGLGHKEAGLPWGRMLCIGTFLFTLAAIFWHLAH